MPNQQMRPVALAKPSAMAQPLREFPTEVDNWARICGERKIEFTDAWYFCVPTSAAFCG